MARVIEPEPDMVLSATAANGREALTEIRRARPDLLLLDLEMPVLDGIRTLQELRKFDRHLPVIVFSGQGQDVGRATLEALAAGAHDYVEKPTAGRSLRESISGVREELVPRIRALTARTRGVRAGVTSSMTRTTSGLTRPVSGPPITALAIGSSTGGPQALMQIFTELGSDVPVPVFVAQHMRARFTGVLANRLCELSGLAGGEARDGAPVRAGQLYVAPGDRHMTVRRGRVTLDSGPPVHNCRPAVDPLFFSAAKEYGSGLLAVVLTGMGRDGGPGSVAVRGAGGTVFAQDRESSVVYGMPRAVVEAGAASRVVPLSGVAAAIRARLSAGVTAAAV